MKKPWHVYFSPDLLFVFLLLLLIALTVLGAVFHSIWLLLAALAVAAFSVFRVFSKNLAARTKENEVFSRILLAPVRGARRLLRRLFPDRRHVFVRCPSCSAKLRFKKVRGSFAVTCPRCQTRFPVKID